MSTEPPYKANHVKLMRNRFEAGEVEKPSKADFSRSTSIPSSSVSTSSDSNKRGSIRRSPAFRNKPSLAKSASEKILNVNEQEYSTLSSTLKRILRKPLPGGPPPLKPPRTFNSPIREISVIHEFENASNSESISNTENKVLHKTKLDHKSSSFLSCISSCESGTYYDPVQVEPIYSEPFQNDSIRPSVPTELHYMVSDISTEKNKTSPNQCLKSKSTSAIQKVLVEQKYEKINLLLNAVFDKESAEESASIVNQQNSNKLNRSLTDRRKKYVLGVSQSFKNDKQHYGSLKLNEYVEEFKPTSIAERVEYYKKFIDQNGNEKPEPQVALHEKLFISCLLIGVNLSENKPYVKSAFPTKSHSLPFIEHFVYPTNSSCRTQIMQGKKDQNHCLVLTDDRGMRLYGYCRQVVPENSTVALPLTYCLITNKKSSGFYFQILQEIETRHGQSENQLNFMLTSLHSLPMPKSGRVLHLKLPTEPLRGPDVANLNETPRSFFRIPTKRLSLDNNPAWLKNSSKNEAAPLASDNVEYATTDEIFIKRPADLRLENKEISILYQSTTNKILVTIFGSLLIERKIVLISNSISKLSSCVLALESILYPLEWQHTIIAVVPKDLGEITQAPIPVLVGILKTTDDNLSFHDFEEGLIVDLDLKTIVKSCGDESSLLPDNLRKSLMLSLEMVDLLVLDWPLSNVLIAEAFLRFFVELFADLNTANFKKDEFLQKTNDRSTILFLEWFVETSIFQQFLKQKLQHDQKKAKTVTEERVESFYDLFNEKILEKSKSLHYSSSQQYKKIEVLVKNCKLMNRKARTFKDKIKDFFNSEQ